MIMNINEIECKACGCKGIHACIGKQVTMTKVGDEIFVNGIRDFIDRQVIKNRDACLVCGEVHGIGNLPCPYMMITLCQYPQELYR